MSSYFFYLIGLFFLVNVSFAFIPYWTRKTENFGVSISESMYFRQDFKVMRKKYTSILVIISVILFVSFLILGFQLEEKTVMILFTIVTVAYFVSSFLLYLPFHFKMKQIKEVENWQQDRKQSLVIDTKFREENLTYSNGWFLIPALITIATIAFTFIVYENIPKEIPIHTSFSGKVTYDKKSMGNVLILPITQLFLVGMFLVINYVIKHSKQQVSVENPHTSKQQNVMFRRRWSLYMVVTSILITIMFTFLQMTFIYPSLLAYEALVTFSFTGIILFGAILLSITTGQGGSRIKRSEKNENGKIDRDDDRHWKLGQFYVNKNDPSIFVEKRFGVGWTNNWAHPVSWIFIILILGLGIGIPILLILL